MKFGRAPTTCKTFTDSPSCHDNYARVTPATVDLDTTRRDAAVLGRRSECSFDNAPCLHVISNFGSGSWRQDESPLNFYTNTCRLFCAVLDRSRPGFSFFRETHYREEARQRPHHHHLR